MSRSCKRLIGLEMIAEENGTTVFYVDKGIPRRENGMSYEYEGETFIYIRNGLKEVEEAGAFSHETGHVFRGIRMIWMLPSLVTLLEDRACNRSALYRISHDDYMDCMRNPHINSDYDMAEELEVEIDAIQRARNQYAARGLFVTRPPEYYD